MPPGNRAPERGIAPHNTYPCKGEDRWCVIAVSTENEWECFVEAIGNPKLDIIDIALASKERETPEYIQLDQKNKRFK